MNVSPDQSCANENFFWKRKNPGEKCFSQKNERGLKGGNKTRFAINVILLIVGRISQV
jgi:hypothetical protein